MVGEGGSIRGEVVKLRPVSFLEEPTRGMYVLTVLKFVGGEYDGKVVTVTQVWVSGPR